MQPQLKPHQEYALTWLGSRQRGILAMQQRMGKTPVALLDIAGPANILVPSYLKIQWQRECSRWRPDLRVRIMSSGERALDYDVDVWITNYEILQDVQLAAVPHLIVDEGHYCKSHEAKRTITTLALAERAQRVRWLTGTVMPNRSMELWPVMSAMRAVRMSATDFGIKYAGGYVDQWGKWNFRGDTATDELRAKLAPFLLRMTREQIGMDANEWRVVALDLPVDAREKAYDLGAIARDPRPVAFEGLADLLHFQGRAKIPLAMRYLRDLIEDGTVPLLVFAWHADVIAELSRELTSCGLRVGVITGSVPMRQRDQIVTAFGAGEIDVLIGNIKAAGVGLPLHAAEHVVFVEGRWTPADMEQAADRGVSMGRLRALPVDVLTVDKSIDEFMVRRCLEKSRIIDRIIQPTEDLPWQGPNRIPEPSPLAALRLPRPSSAPDSPLLPAVSAPPPPLSHLP